MPAAACFLVLPMFNACVVIPVYDHANAISAVVEAVLAHQLPCILVDDGSAPDCAAVLDRLVAAHPQQLVLVRHARNSGKGAAVMTGFARASLDGYTHVLQIDADGQHDIADIPAFLRLATEHPAAIIAGYPVYDASVPSVRRYARYLTHVWVWINTLSLQIRDSMCGFRLYPLAPVMALAQRRKLGAHMNFDTEILVRLFWDDVEVINQPTRVTYPSDGVSHFRLWQDNALITVMHTTLFFGMLLRLPILLARKVRGR
jgi:glycosyltransferase involved in cell wall biosynthesis